MAVRSLDSFATRSELSLAGKKFSYFSLPKLGKALGRDLSRLPFSLREPVQFPVAPISAAGFGQPFSRW